MLGRVVTEHDHLDALEAHDAIALGPASVVADHHAKPPAHGLPDRPAEIAGLEIALLEILKDGVRPVIGMTRQVDLAVLADDLA